MPRIYLKDFIFGGKTFCCCLPVRFGLISMSVLGIFVGGILSIICWFSVANFEVEKQTKAAFIVGGLVETILFVASILGFVGAIVRKQSFVQTYAYILYVHFMLNLAVAIYLLVMVTKITSTAVVKACQQTVKDTGAQDQCTGLLRDVSKMIIIISVIVLFIEMYGAIIATRYLNQIQGEKRTARSSRIQAAEEYEIQMRNRNSAIPRKSSPPSDFDFSQDFNPYEAAAVHHSATGSSHSYHSVPLSPDGNEDGGGTRIHGKLEEEEGEPPLRDSLPNPFLGKDEKSGDYESSQPVDEVDPPPRYLR